MIDPVIKAAIRAEVERVLDLRLQAIREEDEARRQAARLRSDTAQFGMADVWTKGAPHAL